MTIQSKQCAYNNNFNEIPLFYSISISVYLCAIFWMAILINCRRRYFFSLSIEWAGKTKNNYNAFYRLQFGSIHFIFVNCHFCFSFFAFVFGGWFQDIFFKWKNQQQLTPPQSYCWLINFHNKFVHFRHLITWSHWCHWRRRCRWMWYIMYVYINITEPNRHRKLKLNEVYRIE